MAKTIAIFCAGQSGDCLTISSVLRYRQELWGDAKIVWYLAKGKREAVGELYIFSDSPFTQDGIEKMRRYADIKPQEEY